MRADASEVVREVVADDVTPSPVEPAAAPEPLLDPNGQRPELQTLRESRCGVRTVLRILDVGDELRVSRRVRFREVVRIEEALLGACHAGLAAGRVEIETPDPDHQSLGRIAERLRVE